MDLKAEARDALALLAETALHHGIDPGAPGERYRVVVHVDAEVLADAGAPGQSVLEDGARVPAGTSHGGPTTLSNLALLCVADTTARSTRKASWSSDS